jgi:hypothetical protein
MRRAALKIASGETIDRDDHAAMSEALARLYRAAANTVHDVVASLSPSERARLAVYCYGRVHLNRIGLTIAAQCDLDHLVVASSSATAGRTLFAQSRDISDPNQKPLHGRRAITLARSAPSHLGSLVPALLSA